MNCEGSEHQILEDLRKASALDRIQGFVGRWDDLRKLNPSLDEQFRVFLQEHSIKRVGFCNRDWRSKLRLMAIKCEFVTILT